MTQAQRAQNALNELPNYNRVLHSYDGCEIDCMAWFLANHDTIRQALEQMADEETIRLPRKLTAENGYKAHMIGEFSEEFGYYEYAEDRVAEVPVTWDTIKRIHDRVVAFQDRKNKECK
jgi:hypothetical protein